MGEPASWCVARGGILTAAMVAAHGGHGGCSGVGGLLWLVSVAGSFDNFGSSMLLLYVMSTGDEWEIQMFTMMDSAGTGSAPVRNDFAMGDALFSIVWMFIGSLFVHASARAATRTQGATCLLSCGTTGRLAHRRAVHRRPAHHGRLGNARA